MNYARGLMGLTLLSIEEKYGWAELKGPNGYTLGIAQQNEYMEQKAGSNAVLTLTVKNLRNALEELKKKGVTLIGEIIEVPGEVLMQTVKDEDGNTLQIVQKVSKAG